MPHAYLKKLATVALSLTMVGMYILPAAAITGYTPAAIASLFDRYGYTPSAADVSWWQTHSRNQWGDLEWNLARRQVRANTPKVAVQQSCVDASCPLGTTIPVTVALFETSLQASITSSDTSMTLVNGTDKDGNTLSGTYAFIIDEGESIEEFVQASCTDTACSGMTRGISVVSASTTVTALKQPHRRGASVKMTDFPIIGILTRIFNDQGTLPVPIHYQENFDLTTSSNTTLASKAYVDSVGSSGAANANESTKGISELSTGIEAASSTSAGGTGARLVLPGSLATSTPSANAGLQVVVTENDGKLSQKFLDLNEPFAFGSTASTTFSGKTTLSGTTDLYGTTTAWLALTDGSVANILHRHQPTMGYAWASGTGNFIMQHNLGVTPSYVEVKWYATNHAWGSITGQGTATSTDSERSISLTNASVGSLFALTSSTNYIVITSDSAGTSWVTGDLQTLNTTQAIINFTAWNPASPPLRILWTVWP
ncbi:MAG: hypothetical protein PHI63_04780 [Patescibacteria group bacterium]|nr:hypothetical protein [Patescibacteria group bacterium]